MHPAREEPQLPVRPPMGQAASCSPHRPEAGTRCQRPFTRHPGPPDPCRAPVWPVPPALLPLESGVAASLSKANHPGTLETPCPTQHPPSVSPSWGPPGPSFFPPRPNTALPGGLQDPIRGKSRPDPTPGPVQKTVGPGPQGQLLEPVGRQGAFSSVPLPPRIPLVAGF